MICVSKDEIQLRWLYWWWDYRWFYCHYYHCHISFFCVSSLGCFQLDVRCVFCVYVWCMMYVCMCVWKYKRLRMFIDRHLSDASACYFLLNLKLYIATIDGEKIILWYWFIVVFVCFVCIGSYVSRFWDGGSATRKLFFWHYSRPAVIIQNIQKHFSLVTNSRTRKLNDCGYL